MKKSMLRILVLMISLCLFSGTLKTYAHPPQTNMSQSEVMFKNNFRRLWFDHVLWTSNYITSATTTGALDQKDVLTRLLKNQEDIGNAVKPVYGEEFGNKLTTLLKDHILIAGKIVEAAKNKNESMVKKLNQEWHKNADDIAAFLHAKNPLLKLEDLKELLYMHLQLVTNDLTASLNKDWKSRITAIDEGVSHIILMADAISDGVVKQFPNKFSQ